MKKLVLALCILHFSCSSEKVNNENLCLDFIKLNKTLKFRYLFEISTLDTRLSSTYDEKTKQNRLVFNEIAVFCEDDKFETNYFIVPTNKSNFLETNKKYINKKLFYDCKNKGVDDIEFYDFYIKNVLNEIRSISTPKYYNNDSPIVDSNPKSGNFIEFILNDNASVFYLNDESALTPYWKDKFAKIKKVDGKWYYECK